jgi:hypothetical protein
MELAAEGMLTGFPAAKAAVEEVLVIGTMTGVQGVTAAPHPVEVAKAAGLGGFVALRTVKLMADLG